MTERNDERGAALISILLLLIIMSALSAALTISTRTEVMVARNRHSAAQARAAAESGLNHAAEAVIANLLQWNANGFGSPNAAITRLLQGPDDQVGNAARDADNGSLENLGIPRPPARLGLNNVPGVGYEARVFDEDDPGRGLTLTPVDRASIQENGNATNDGNSSILVRAIGYANDGTSLTLEATISPQGLPAILANGDLEVAGNVTVTGANGSVHTNDDLETNGNVTIAQDLTASGTYEENGNVTTGGIAAGGQPQIAVPPVRALDYRPQADFVLTAGGRITTLAGVVLCDASANNNACRPIWGWQFNSGNEWVLDQQNATGGTYFAEMDVRLNANVGSNANPLPLTVIALGSIEVQASPDLRPDTAGLMFVTDEDLRINGNMQMAAGIEGQMLVHEQLRINGTPTIFGNIVVENAATVSGLVTENRINGNPTITSNGLSNNQSFRIGAWREVR